MAKLQLKVSVMDCEPVDELVNIIIGYPREEIPEALREKIEEWTEKYTSDDD